MSRVCRGSIASNLCPVAVSASARGVRNADLANDPDFATSYPAIAEALLSGASGQLRNAATVGGNLLQRTRCGYFYDPASACNKRAPGSGCDARGGENRLHAVLGWSESCIATHPSDFCVPLVALDAHVEIEGPSGRRKVAVEALHRLPGDTPERDSVLAPGDLIVALLLPKEAQGFAAHARYLKVRERTSFAFAVVSAAAALRIEQGTIWDARLALGGVAPKPWRAVAAEKILAGCYSRCRHLPPRRGGGARRRQTFRRQRLQDRTGAAAHRARVDIGGRWNAGARCSSSCLSIFLRCRSAS